MKRLITLASAALLLCGLTHVTLAQTAAQTAANQKAQKALDDARNQ